MSVAKKIQLRNGEEIIAVIHPYWLKRGWRYILGAIFIFASFFFIFWLFRQGFWGYVMFVFGVMIGVHLIFTAWFFRRTNCLVITSERIVDITRLGWFDEVISSANYFEIKDVSIRKKGVFANIFNYGAITVQTKNQQVVLELPDIRNPVKVYNLIFEISEESRKKRMKCDSRTVYESFVKIIPELSGEDLDKIRVLISEHLEICENNGEIKI